MSLSADERETIVRMNGADDLANVWTAQRPVITKLRKNPAAELLREGKHDGSAWAEFELPKNLVSFRRPMPKRELSEGERQERSARLKAAKNSAASSSGEAALDEMERQMDKNAAKQRSHYRT